MSEHCQSGRADICLAGQRDGICCPPDSCDIDDGVREDPRDTDGGAMSEELCKPPCDCAYQTEDGLWLYRCDCGNSGDLVDVAVWCSDQAQAARIRELEGENDALRAERDRLAQKLETPTHYWSEDANCLESALDWEEFYHLEDCAELEPGEHVDFEVTPLIVLPTRTIRVRRNADGEYESDELSSDTEDRHD